MKTKNTHGGQRKNSGRKNFTDNKRALRFFIRESSTFIIDEDEMIKISLSAIENELRKHQWTKNEVLVVAASYTDSKTFLTNCPAAYEAAVKQNMLQTLFQDSVKPIRLFSTNTINQTVTILDKKFNELPIWDFPNHFYLSNRIINLLLTDLDFSKEHISFINKMDDKTYFKWLNDSISEYKKLTPLDRVEGGICYEYGGKQLRFWGGSNRAGSTNPCLSGKNLDGYKWTRAELVRIGQATNTVLESLQYEIYTGELNETIIRERGSKILQELSEQRRLNRLRK